MRFRKPESDAGSPPFRGEREAENGHASLAAAEAAASEAILVQRNADFGDVIGSLGKLAPKASSSLIREVDGARAVASMAAAYAEVGLRTAALVSDLRGAHEVLHDAAGKRLPFVVNLTCRAVRRQAGSLHGGHDDYYAAADTGFFQLFAASAQEASDFALIAHRIAELSLTPGLCAQDFYQTSHSVQSVDLPEREFLMAYLGRAEDEIESPTPAQSILFGEQRRRVPVLVDRDHPAGVGGVQDRESYFRSVTAQRAFFYGHVERMAEQAMREFGELTGRFYAGASGYRTGDADVVVVAQGAIVEELRAVVDCLRDKERVKAGLVGMTMFRPFPGAELTKLLKGRSVVTVLERTDQPLAEDLPLLREIRCAIDKATENGIADGASLPYPDYDVYRGSDDRPRVLSGVYGVGGDLPSFGELLAVYHNMLAAVRPKRKRQEGIVRQRFYVGADFGPPSRRFPHLQTLHQRLDRSYPDLATLSLPTADGSPEPSAEVRTVRMHSLSGQGGLFAGNLFAQTLSGVMEWTVRTFPEGGLDPLLQPASLTICHAERDEVVRGKPSEADVVLVTPYNLLEDLPVLSARKAGTLIVESNRDPAELWAGLSRRTEDTIRARELRVHVIDARKIATEAASNPSFIDQLTVWALLGAYAKTCLKLAQEDLGHFVEALLSRLEARFGRSHYLNEDITNAFLLGADELAELAWASMDEKRDMRELEPPWTVKETTHTDGSVFDLTRFWHSVGYLYDSGQASEALTDPYLATGIVPARSSAFRDMTSFRLRIPGWLQENCTGCGLCWSQCPESALPPSVQHVASTIETAVNERERQGGGTVQMKRIGEHLAKQAYRLVLNDGINQYMTMGPLLEDAFSRLMEKMGIDGDKLDEMRAEFDPVREMVAEVPFAKTDTFFNTPHGKEKGAGCLLTLALNPLSCTGCGLCIAVCPDDALDWVDQTADQLSKCHTNWQFQMMLPEPPGELLDRHISREDPETQVYRLLGKQVYHSMVGGDGAAPGNTVKTAVHLATATVESIMRPRFERYVVRLGALIERLEDKIQGKVADSLKINDFEEFGRQLTRLQHKALTASELSRLVGDIESHGIDPDRLSRLTGLLAKLKEQRHCYIEGAGGTGRARMVLAIDAGSTSFWNNLYPYNPLPHPWVCHLPGDAAAVAVGLFEGIAARLSREMAVVRSVELEIGDAYDPAEHDAYFEQFTWNDFTDEELELMPPIVVLVEAGTTTWESVSRLLSMRFPVKVVVVDREGLAVPAPGGSETVEEGESVLADEQGLLAVTRRDVFVLQTSIGHPGHLIQGVSEGLARKTAALFCVHAPDAQTSGVGADETAGQARLAYLSRSFPLFHFDPGEASPLTLVGNPDIGNTWTSREQTVAEPSGATATRTVPLTVADWAVNEARFSGHFKIMGKGYRSAQMKTLADYIELEPSQREGLEPYIDLIDRNGRHVIAVVSPEMVAATERKRDAWRYLKALAGVGVAAEAPEPVEAESPTKAAAAEAPEPAPRADESAYQRLTQRLLTLAGYTEDPDHFKQSLRRFVTRNDRGDDGE
jgi:pyruvate-ferredoxin/flavodoxin oxidoreductase